MKSFQLSKEDYEAIFDASKRDPEVEAARKRTLERVRELRDSSDRKKAMKRAQAILDVFSPFSVYVQVEREKYLELIIKIIMDKSYEDVTYISVTSKDDFLLESKYEESAL